MDSHETDYLNFSIDAHLLQELGERLVSKITVAYAELIKNAYDADASVCLVHNTESIVRIVDDGHGMTLDEIRDRWMRVATTNKTALSKSRYYNRPLTGAKGVGRFAARTLGRALFLSSTAFDETLRCFTTVKIYFDWANIDSADHLNQTEIKYSRIIHDEECKPGTTLIIRHPSQPLNEKETTELRTEILGLTNAFKPLLPDSKSANLAPSPTGADPSDPGFEVLFSSPSESSPLNLAESVLRQYAWRVVISAPSRKEYRISLWKKDEDQPSVSTTLTPANSTIKPIYVDIRFFPRRRGQFTQGAVKGQEAYTWVSENHGIRVYDRGFRVFPYGEENDDWLRVDRDRAHSERQWASAYSQRYIPLSPEEQRNTATNPMLYLPSNHQMIGAVFVSSNQSQKDGLALIPSMDREGFVDNEAYAELFNIVRFGIEYIAKLDRQSELERKRLEHEEELEVAQAELKEVIQAIDSSPTISLDDKQRLKASYAHVASSAEELERFQRETTQALDLMTLLGVLAGVMTHEHESVLWNIRRAIEEIEKAETQNSKLAQSLDRLKDSADSIANFVDYTRSFVKNIDTEVRTDLHAKPRIRRVVRTFKPFADARNIQVDMEIPSRIMMPPIPIMMYEGIVMNLLVNALKAVIARAERDKISKRPRVLIKSWADKRYHYLSVSDTGIGIDPKLRKRIWDPLFTTTSHLDSPLGTGIGLGLPIVKRVVESVNGEVEVTDPEPEFVTRFEIRIPRKSDNDGN